LLSGVVSGSQERHSRSLNATDAQRLSILSAE